MVGLLFNFLCIYRKNNVLIICDEVMSGWGRTGEVFAYMKHKIKPDIITSAKGLTSGYAPLGVVIVKNNIILIIFFILMLLL